MDRRQLEIKRTVEGLGYKVESFFHTGGNHFIVLVSDGQTKIRINWPNSSGDRRWIYNKKAEIRRIFRQVDEGGAPRSRVGLPERNV